MVSQRASQDCLCAKHLGLLSENARLREDVARLKARLSRQERSAREEPFGLSTPSSRRLVKPSLPELTEEEARRRKGGAPAGRAGHGWKTPGAAEPGIEELPRAGRVPVLLRALEDFPGGAEDVRDLIECHHGTNRLRQQQNKRRVRDSCFLSRLRPLIATDCRGI
jgi:hypothetical protein